MAKVIKIEETKILLGTDDGGLKEVTKDSFSFEPQIGDEVEVFENESRIVVIKKEKTEKAQPSAPSSNSGININVQNTVEAPQPSYVQASTKQTKVVSKLAYCLLAFFLGWIGVHKFYAGKTGTGVVYLLFCWTGVPAFLALIDFIIGLCKHSDSNGNIAI